MFVVNVLMLTIISEWKDEYIQIFSEKTIGSSESSISKIEIESDTIDTRVIFKFLKEW